MLTSLWPSISLTTLIGTPLLSRRVAALCLRSYIRVPDGRCARSSNCIHERYGRLFTLMFVPMLVGNNHSHCCGCCLRASAATLDSLMVRLLLSVFGRQDCAPCRRFY